MKKILIFWFTAFVFIGCSVDSLMQETELDLTDTEKVYSDIALTRRVVYDLYARMRIAPERAGTFGLIGGGGASSCAMLDNATDDGAGNTTRAGGAIEPGIELYIKGGVDASKFPVPNVHPWNFYYKAIRSANTFLENVDHSPLDAEEKSALKNQVRFLRAYYHHELFKWYGALVIADRILDPLDYKNIKRESLEATVRWIVKEFEELSQPGVLPDNYESADYGRPTRGAAMGYKARTLLYAASPLHAHSGVTWDEAAKAAEKMIAYCDEGGYYALYYDMEQPERSYKKLFNARTNCEIIMSYLRAPTNDLYNMLPAFNPWNVNKELLTCPTQWLVDSYDMKDGSEPILGYNSPIDPIINAESGYDEQDPYKNRDPRFEQSILYDGATWDLVNGKPEKINISSPEPWGSGYFLIKYLDDQVDYRKGEKTSMNFPIMRYAEILLIYAEAINEAEDTPAAREKAVKQLNKIRRRAGISKDLLSERYSQNSLRERIRKERRIELAFEDHRFYDIRRWLIAKDVMKLPATGVQKIENKYRRVTLDTRTYNERMNLTPIPLNEVNNCPLIYQNPGY